MRFISSGCRAVLALSLSLALLACADPAEESPAYLQLSYESIPGTGVALPLGTIDTSASTYADKLAFTQDVFDTLVPEVMIAVGMNMDNTTSELTPGGFSLETNPSLQMRIPLDDAGEVNAQAERLAAALGYTMYQWSVLVTDFSAIAGNTGYAIVEFPVGALDADLAQSFFAHAATVDSGLGGGYLAFGDEMIFLNVRDDAGEPYSGLDDLTFVAGLESAAQSFSAADTVFLESGAADARFVGNDWDSAPLGDQYLATVGEDAADLEPLRDTFVQLIDEAAVTYGWTVTPDGTRSPDPRAIRRGHWRELALLGSLPESMRASSSR